MSRLARTTIYIQTKTHGAWALLPAHSLPFFLCAHKYYIKVGQNYNIYIYRQKHIWCVGSTACALFAFFLCAHNLCQGWPKLQYIYRQKHIWCVGSTACMLFAFFLCAHNLCPGWPELQYIYRQKHMVRGFYCLRALCLFPVCIC